MTYIEKMSNVTKGQIKKQFKSFFKMPDAKHPVAKKFEDQNSEED